VGGSGSTVQLLNKIQELEKTVAEIIASSGGDDGLTLDDVPNLGPVGPSATRGLAPDPGLRQPPTGLASHVLVEDATWGYPYRGLIRVATGDDDTFGRDVINVHGGIHASDIIVGSADVYDLHVHGDIEWNNQFWDDLRSPSTSLRLPSSGNPTVNTTDGTLEFDKGDSAWVMVQMPHTWREGSYVWPHLHWYPADGNAGNVHWQIEYDIANVDGVYSGSFTALDATDTCAGVALTHQLATTAGIDMTGYTLSCMLRLIITRVDDGADTYASLADLLEVDIHYQRDSPGSSQEYVK
jgi:hypothetical protein